MVTYALHAFFCASLAFLLSAFPSMTMATMAAARAETIPLPKLNVVERKTVSEGVDYLRLSITTSSSQLTVGHTLQVDPNLPLMEVRPVLAGDRLGRTETLSSMASRYGAIGGINGSFFAYGSGLTMPVGNLVIDGTLLSASDFWRTSFGLNQNMEALYGYLNPKPVLQVTDGGTLVIERLNRPYQAGQLHLYNRFWGSSTGTPAGTPEAVLKPADKNRYVVASLGHGNSSIPTGGMVVCGDQAGLTALQAGSVLELNPGLGEDWQGLRHLVTGGPLLVENGKPVFQAQQEGFTGSILDRRARTAIGTDNQGRLLLTVIEAGKSGGVTLEELALLMTSLGAKVAVGLDGGGSSGMWLNGSLVSSLGDSKERPLANAILILRQIPVYLDGTLLPCDVPPTLVQGRVLVPMRAIFAALGADVSWDQKTKRVTAVKDETRIELTIDNNRALVNNRPVMLDVSARVVNGRTLVPIRFVSQTMGAAVQWKPEEKTVYINR